MKRERHGGRGLLRGNSSAKKGKVMHHNERPHHNTALPRCGVCPRHTPLPPSLSIGPRRAVVLVPLYPPQEVWPVSLEEGKVDRLPGLAAAGDDKIA